MSEVMSKIIEVMKEIKPDFDFEGKTSLVDDGLFDSFEVIQFIAEITDVLDVDIPVEEIVPENFNSLEAIEKLINSLLEM